MGRIVAPPVSAPLVHALDRAPDPLETCARLLDLPYPLLLDSAAGLLPATAAARLGRFSFLMADPVAVFSGRAGDRHDPLLAAEAALAPWRTAPVAGLPPFQGGLAGYVGYEYARALERVPRTRWDDAGHPDVVLGLYDRVIAWDHAAERAWVVSTGIGGVDARARLDEMLERLRAPASRGASTEARPTASSDAAPAFPVAGFERVGLCSTFTRDAYLAAVARVREYILAGDIFQANLTQRLEAPLREAPWRFYRRLRERSPAPFGAWFATPDATIMSVSPERFLRASPAGEVETRPIKGTRPRGAGPADDAALAAALLASEKDRAENVMIVDLLRNDLSRVCEPGSVLVPELLALESHPTVHHLVSTVTGRLRPEVGPVALLRAAFPGGSITGAPKVRAMEIIAELEPAPRGVYCGSIGYVSATDAMDTSIAIRTAVVTAEGRCTFGAGGGIVADSTPEAEWDETLAKARAFVEALAEAAAVAAHTETASP